MPANGIANGVQQQSNLDPQLHPGNPASPQTIATQLQSAISGYENAAHTPHTPAPPAWMSTAQTDPHTHHNHAHITRSAPQHHSHTRSQSNSLDPMSSPIQQQQQDEGIVESRERGLEKENAILLGRIDRMEKEQNEQKEMLAAILGAVRKNGNVEGEGVA